MLSLQLTQSPAPGSLCRYLAGQVMLVSPDHKEKAPRLNSAAFCSPRNSTKPPCRDPESPKESELWPTLRCLPSQRHVVLAAGLPEKSIAPLCSELQSQRRAEAASLLPVIAAGKGSDSAPPAARSSRRSARGSAARRWPRHPLTQCLHMLAPRRFS